MKSCMAGLLMAVLFCVSPALAQSEDTAAAFRRGNESATRSRWDDALSEYARLAANDVRAPSLYWNWAQAAAASGRKGLALWALLRAQELSPGDSSTARDIERLRLELGLDPSEVSLGFFGDLRFVARRFHFDALALGVVFVSVLLLFGSKPRSSLALGCCLAGVLLVSPFFLSTWQAPRGVVVQKEAPLMDVARNHAVALANLREGEVVPLLGEEGEYVKIQDASGARGFAHKGDVRRIGTE